MKAAIYESFGKPDEVLKCQETGIPEPEKGMVRVRMGLSSIHNHDLITVEGNYGYRPDLPAIGGSEGMGIIDALGEGVEDLKVGQRVAAMGAKGSWAEYFCVPARVIVPLPGAIDDETAAQMLAMPLSALFAIDALGAKQGDWIIQTAATGAVAKVVAQACQDKGINVIGLVRRDSAVKELADLGIDKVVSTEKDDWQDQVRQLCGDAPLIGAIDGVGGEIPGEILHMLGENAIFLSFGAMSGQPLTVSPNDLILKQIEMRGFWLGKMLETMAPERLASFVKDLVTLLAQGKVTLETDGVFPLDQIDEAARATRAGGKSGKVLIKP
ncbi:zinc-binding dehydrogenase [Altericroceibacterium endophyticum]|uniref:Zinc-binding dehydrogenase n=1 Tax=Altericroceibacterium endophyticum TaxID=1808508 RepID=A0A6I4T7C7_9SPHN|nr:zinc-binding dehydrogenase [Altericroceibacterium endophyticum]MXO65873.1 zinc-binding dehydrogenase [Altericroceibacterium endophyticum]